MLTRCKCPYLAEDTIARDGHIRLSTRQSAFDRAEAIKQAWEEAGTTKATQQPGPDILRPSI